MRVVSHTDWGADKQVLLRLYRTIIRSKLDYGSIIYGSARKSYLQILDTVHHQGLRLALGAFSTSPVSSLYAEANEPSLADRREKLALQFALKIKSDPNNPAFNCIFKPNYKNLFENKPSFIPTFGIRVANSFQTAKIDTDIIDTFENHEIPPWTFRKPIVNFSLHSNSKSDTSPSQFLDLYNETLTLYPNFTAFFTDGSKDKEKVSAAFVVNDFSTGCRLPDNSSIFTAEAKAISLALNYIKTHAIERAVICSDSLSVLQSLCNRNLKSVPILKLLTQIHELRTSEVVFCWVPGHIGITGNEKADRAAKSALSLDPCDFKVPFTDFKPLVSAFVVSKWQTAWNECITNKLHSIKPKLGEWPPGYKINTRRDEVVITRLRIGHTHLTHSYLLKREDQPFCFACDEPLTVHHIMIDCIDLQLTRDQFYRVSNMRELFTKVKIDDILSFLKAAGLYYKI